jgi:hypothetical protein
MAESGCYFFGFLRPLLEAQVHRCKAIAVMLAMVICLAVTIAGQSTAVTAERLKTMPLAFTKSTGQWDERVLFRANAGGATMWFTKEGVTYQFTRRVERSGAVSVPGLVNAVRPYDPASRLSQEKDSVEQLVITAKFVGANPNPEIIAEGQMECKCIYFLGNELTE